MIASFSHSHYKSGYKIVSLLSLFLLLLVANLSFAQDPNVACTIEKPITCHNGADGQIRATGSGVGVTNYQYSLDKTTWQPGAGDPNPYIFNGLSAANYRIYVRNADIISEVDSCDISLPNPDTLTLATTIKTWSCGALPSCDGSIRTVVTGGVSPYSVTVECLAPAYNVTSSKADTIFGGLCAGAYTVTVSDANGCSVTPVQTTISLDNISPTCTTVPPLNRLIDIVMYNPIARLDTSLLKELADPPFTGFDPNDRDTFECEFDATMYNNLELKITAHQEGNSWSNLDTLLLSYSIGSSGVWTTLLADYCRWEAANGGTCDNTNGNATKTSSVWLDLPDAAGDTLYFRVICESGANRNYVLDSLNIRFNNTTASVSTALSGGAPSNCSDNFTEQGSIEITYKDSALHFYCDDPDNLEFKFLRIWDVEDDCNNRTRYFQNIRVGTPPTVSAPGDTTLDICHNLFENIPQPVFYDACFIADTSWAITTKIGNHPVGTPGVGVIPDITFTRPVTYDTTYVITWTVSDSAGFTASGSMDVTIRAPIKVVVTPLDGIKDFCSGDSKEFQITITGGTGTYVHPPTSINPAVDWGTSNIIDGTGTFTTSNLVVGSQISVTVTDVSVTGETDITGGCVSSEFIFTSDDGAGDDFFVHPKISTGTLERH